MTLSGDRVALGIFVGTPGLSPPKTRLAADLGGGNAIALHQLAVEAIRAVARVASDAVAPHWAVAERSALSRAECSAFPVVSRGGGGLAERMATVHASLPARHGRALLIGADAPRVTPALLRRAALALDDPAHPYVIGSAEDGGFWLFGGRRTVPDGVWTGVAYSRPETAERFLAALARHGRAFHLPVIADVDPVAEFRALRTTLEGGTAVREQDALLRRLRALPQAREPAEMAGAPSPEEGFIP